MCVPIWRFQVYSLTNKYTYICTCNIQICTQRWMNACENCVCVCDGVLFGCHEKLEKYWDRLGVRNGEKKNPYTYIHINILTYIYIILWSYFSYTILDACIITHIYQYEYAKHKIFRNERWIFHIKNVSTCTFIFYMLRRKKNRIEWCAFGIFSLRANRMIWPSNVLWCVYGGYWSAFIHGFSMVSYSWALIIGSRTPSTQHFYSFSALPHRNHNNVGKCYW